MEGDKEKLAVVEAQLRWLSPIVERIEVKVDNLSESHWKLYGKMLGAAGVVGCLSALLVELIRH